METFAGSPQKPAAKSPLNEDLPTNCISLERGQLPMKMSETEMNLYSRELVQYVMQNSKAILTKIKTKPFGMKLIKLARIVGCTLGQHATILKSFNSNRSLLRTPTTHHPAPLRVIHPSFSQIYQSRSSQSICRNNRFKNNCE